MPSAEHFFYEEDRSIFKELQTNADIMDREVRVIDENGTMIGVMSADRANRLADERNLDLVKISPTANPPVCKFMDYKKYRYEQIKHDKEESKKARVSEIKDLWLSASIDTGDLEVKARKAREFLLEGNKVRLSIRLRGRQQAHPEIAVAVMEDFFNMLSDVATLDKKPLVDGKNITMQISPVAKK